MKNDYVLRTPFFLVHPAVTKQTVPSLLAASSVSMRKCLPGDGAGAGEACACLHISDNIMMEETKIEMALLDNMLSR